jgi:hypothetical protein
VKRKDRPVRRIFRIASILGIGLFFVAGIALAANIDNAKRYLKGGIDVWNDIAGKDTTSTMLISSDTSNATATSTVGTITLKATEDIASSDLVVDVQSSAAAHLLSVNELGDLTILDDFVFGGGDVRGSSSGVNYFTSQTDDATTSTTVASISFRALINITNGDLVMNVENSAGDNLLTVSEQGALTALTTVTATTGLIVGSGGSTIAKYVTAVTGATDIASAAASSTSTATAAVSGAALGDICSVSPMQDDAAWDEGGLTCFVESSGSVKIVYHADSSGGDPGASNTYRISLIQH